MKTRLFAILFLAGSQGYAFAQQHLNGRVVDQTDGRSLAGATIRTTNAGLAGHSDSDGRFRIAVGGTDTLLVSYLGYEPKRLPVGPVPPGGLTVGLSPLPGILQEVTVNTGYQVLSKERATGSFTHIDQKTLDEVVAPTILEKLEGITNGLQVDRRTMLPEAPAAGATGRLRIRGVSTIESNEEPLIILDNFPYEGRLDAINPNDVASITVLRDAAAASIWGARAGNGVIVITTKRGGDVPKPVVSATSNVTVGRKPDLFYDRSFLLPSAIMGIEADLFANGRYQERNQTAIPAYVELLIRKRDGLIAQEVFEATKRLYANTDLRQEALHHLYRPSVSQQYALNVRGGGDRSTYYLSGGYDRNARSTVGDDQGRLSLLARHGFRPVRQLEVSTGIRYARQVTGNNGIGMYNLYPKAAYSPLADDRGTPLATVANYRFAYEESATQAGLLDWLYRPLEERDLRDFTERQQDVQLDASVEYVPFPGLSVSGSYQFLQGRSDRTRYSHAESYYVRNLVNRFTQADGSRIIPEGGIREAILSVDNQVHSGRLQAGYDGAVAGRWHLTSLAGAEIRQDRTTGTPGSILYGFSDEVYTGVNNFDHTRSYPARPTGSATIPQSLNYVSLRTDRFVSYFGNTALSFDRRYTLSGSMRWDGSNLFGVKTNQKGVPLWSIGGSWEVKRGVRLRATYGSSGNVNHGVSVYPIITYGTDLYTGLPFANLRSAGNPSLRWETVSAANFGVDFSGLGGRVSGSVEYFSKFASDLIGEDVLDPTSGIVSTITPVVTNEVNYASLRTQGVDVQLTSRNLTGRLTWETIWLFSHTRSKVSRFNTTAVQDAESMLDRSRTPVPGKPLDILYAFPWEGLDPETGRTIIHGQDGTRASDYRAWVREFPIDGLVAAGVTVPPYAGSFRNTVSYAGLQLSATVTWKAGHVFRRTSMLPGGLSGSTHTYHGDYLLRWQRPGDEQQTIVPSMLPYGAPATATYEDRVFRYSEALVVRGDHIRLQDVRLAYTFPKRLYGAIGLQGVQCYVYLRNLGLLWRYNDLGIDPDFANANFTAPFSSSFGIQLSF